VDGNQLILIIKDVTDSIDLKNSVEKQSQEKARINQTSRNIDLSLMKLEKDIDEMIRKPEEEKVLIPSQIKAHS